MIGDTASEECTDDAADDKEDDYVALLVGVGTVLGMVSHCVCRGGILYRLTKYPLN